MSNQSITWRTHLNPTNRTDCMLVAKGPTAIEAHDRYFGSLFVLNDAIRILSDRQVVDAMFCDSIHSALKCEAMWDRIRLALFPTIHPDYPGHLVRMPRYEGFVETDTPQTFEQNLTAEKISHMPTATSALCLLVRSGFKRIWCFGHDGGRKRAEGLEQHRSGTYDRKTAEMKRCAEYVSEMGVDVRFWPEGF